MCTIHHTTPPLFLILPLRGMQLVNSSDITPFSNHPFKPGSIAAITQGMIGNVAASGIFATLQSAAMGGYGAVAVNGAVQTGGAILGAALLRGRNNRPPDDGPPNNRPPNNSPPPSWDAIPDSDGSGDDSEEDEEGEEKKKTRRYSGQGKREDPDKGKREDPDKGKREDSDKDKRKGVGQGERADS